MIIAIIAGGSGTRLWPLSQPDYPKHLLKLTGKNSLLQNTYERSRLVTEKIYVVTEAGHAKEVKAQLPDIPEERILIEPARRGTASCIILALAKIQADFPDEEVASVQADHHIADIEGFVRTIKTAARASRQYHKITLVGLRPTYPATGFGYIHMGKLVETDEGLPVYEIANFKEKPDFDTAKQWLETGKYLWNLGSFVAPVKVFTETMQESAPELYAGYQALCAAKTSEEFNERYLELVTQPIETALIEKTDRTLVIPGEFDWADIGSFLDLHTILKKKKDDNSLKGEVYQVDCTDSMIHGSTKPVIAVGLTGVVVIDTPDGLLVCAKEESQKIGDLVKQLQAQQSKI